MRVRFAGCLLAGGLFLAGCPWPLRSQTAGYDILLPHLALGGGYSSVLSISDPLGLASRDVEISFRDASGSALPVRVDGVQTSGSIRLSLSRFEERSLVLTIDGSAVQTGWVRIAVDRGAKLHASLRFLTRQATGATSDAVGILPSGVQRTWYVVVDQTGAEQYTGVAVANPNAFPVEVEFN